MAAAIQTIREIGDEEALAVSVEDAFPSSRIRIENVNGRFALRMEQHGLLRALDAAELSDGTLRYLLWIAALLTPRPPELRPLYGGTIAEPGLSAFGIEEIGIQRFLRGRPGLRCLCQKGDLYEQRYRRRENLSHKTSSAKLKLPISPSAPARQGGQQRAAFG